MINPVFLENNLSLDPSNYYFFEKGFSEEEIEWISNLEKLFNYSEAVTIGNGLNESVRKSRIKWIHQTDESAWVYRRILEMISEANEALWGFQINGVNDSIQFTEYHGDGGHYDWHMDIGPGSINHRKVSVVVQLSDPSEYEGGDLLLWNGGEPKVAPKGKGNVIIFPSYLMHKVTPTYNGTRKSLVLWAGGGSFK